MQEKIQQDRNISTSKVMTKLKIILEDSKPGSEPQGKGYENEQDDVCDIVF